MVGVAVVVVGGWYRGRRQSERYERCRGALEEMGGGLPCLCMCIYNISMHVHHNSIIIIIQVPYYQGVGILYCMLIEEFVTHITFCVLRGLSTL